MREEKKMQSEERYPVTGRMRDWSAWCPHQADRPSEMEYFGFIHFTVNTFTGKNGERGGIPFPFLIRKNWMQDSGPRLRSGEA